MHKTWATETMTCRALAAVPRYAAETSKASHYTFTLPPSPPPSSFLFFLLLVSLQAYL